MAARMEESFQEKGMSCPPWRQVRSVLAKWGLVRSNSKAKNLHNSEDTQAVSKEPTCIRFGRESKRKAGYPLCQAPEEFEKSHRRSSLLSELRCRPGAVVTTGGCTNMMFACMRS
eukprot:9491036-Pyramimonas_sp.AAC.1